MTDDVRQADDPILSVRGLTVAFDTEAGAVRAVEKVGFELIRGRTLGIVGESGCGKSVTALSIMRLLPRPMARIEAGEVVLDGTDLLSLSADAMQTVRGASVAMVFQEPMAALNPVHTLFKQVSEPLRIHRPELKKKALEAEVVRLLSDVGIPDAESRLFAYPHQLSGGMRQRVMIAMALALSPSILIADEPTTALDVTVQAQILDLIRHIRTTMGMSVIFITHDLGVIAEQCDDVVVMYAGKVVERSGVKALFSDPKHPYTKGLLASMPRLDSPRKTRLETITGQVPGLMDLPSGCRFRNRCPHAMERCATEVPEDLTVGDEHQVACHLYDNEGA
ncbi:ABC transporter ATP-binding protein [Desulfoluna spongiiphila]|uniref:Peptide/nickel transport system ATP-binding protein n=1 Tax=Desulfoluna spongiiphila TaxID=419481 RepID=A0A1G5ABQ9_9BACT|nr:ABC transporter ATP-binding protein [Desulfoluna spongiiphila]SCX75298.1 peptide/nickel transport system ATP-binding protein [Desulfoluna spongiiphila]VVS90744.1 abc transporter-like [Desulfoluna spongiiphila]